jgi:glutamate-1-semialdehyde 2,1-aminomutase
MKISGIEQYQNGKGQKLYQRAKQLIPGGTQLLSKRPEMFAPGIWPAYYQSAKGCRIRDLDGNIYIDMGIMGVGANILGYADEDVDEAVIRAIKDGNSSSLNCPEEVALAEKLMALHPWAGMARYTRGGGEAMAVAVRIARAHTGRDVVLFSGYHGWQDWYLSANLGEIDALDGQLMPGLAPNGVPRGLYQTALPFTFDEIDRLRETLKGREKQIAAIVVEPARGEEAPRETLAALVELAADIGAVLIFDEITSGFRMCPGGIHLRYEVSPDMAVFAKSMANGYAMAAVIGTEKVMQAAQSTFISSTNWTERIGPAAAMATIDKYIQNDVSRHIIDIGHTVQDIWRRAAQKYCLDVHVSGIPTLGHFTFESDYSRELATYFTIRMLSEGFLGFRQFKASFAHGKEETLLYEKAVDAVFKEISTADPGQLLTTPCAHAGFYRLTRE